MDCVIDNVGWVAREREMVWASGINLKVGKNSIPMRESINGIFTCLISRRGSI